MDKLNKERLAWLARSCGVYATALHCKNNGMPLYMALHHLTKKGN